MLGTVAMVNKARGFAILRTPDGMEHLAHIYKFTHQSDFDTLGVGDPVRFTPYHDPKGKGNGMRAKDITRVR